MGTVVRSLPRPRFRLCEFLLLRLLSGTLRSALQSPQIRAFRRVRGLAVGPDPGADAALAPWGRSSPSGAPPPHSRRGSVASTAAVSTGNWWASVSVGDAGGYWDDQGSVGSADDSVHGSGSVEDSKTC